MAGDWAGGGDGSSCGGIGAAAVAIEANLAGRDVKGANNKQSYVARRAAARKPDRLAGLPT